MNEAQWWDCQDPRALLAVLGGRVSERKLRLFLVACGRRLWGPGAGPPAQAALALADHLAEAKGRGGRTVWGLSVGRLVLDCSASEPLVELEPVDGVGALVRAAPASLPAGCGPFLEMLGCRRPALDQVHWLVEHFRLLGLPLEEQAGLFRDVVRGPFRPLFFPAALRQRAGDAARRLADAAYGERVPDALPVLADVLEEAGCAEAELLGHLRGPAPHARGCWALDLVLDRW